MSRNEGRIIGVAFRETFRVTGLYEHTHSHPPAVADTLKPGLEIEPGQYCRAACNKMNIDYIVNSVLKSSEKTKRGEKHLKRKKTFS